MFTLFLHPCRLPVPWLLFSLINGLQPVPVSSNGLFCAIVLLFLMLLFVISSIASCKWKMNKILGFTMFLLYFVFLIISVMLEGRIISCPVSVWVRVTVTHNGRGSENHAKSECTSCYVNEWTWSRGVNWVANRLDANVLGLNVLLGSTCSSLWMKNLTSGGVEFLPLTMEASSRIPGVRGFSKWEILGGKCWDKQEQ